MRQLKHQIIFMFVWITAISCNYNKKTENTSNPTKNKDIDSFYYLKEESLEGDNLGEGGGLFYTESLLELNKTDSTYIFILEERNGCEGIDLKSEGFWRIKKDKIIFYDNNKNEFDGTKAIIQTDTLKFEIVEDEPRKVKVNNLIIKKLILVKANRIVKKYID